MGIQITRYNDKEMVAMPVNHYACICTISYIQAYFPLPVREYTTLTMNLFSVVILTAINEVL